MPAFPKDSVPSCVINKPHVYRNKSPKLRWFVYRLPQKHCIFFCSAIVFFGRNVNLNLKLFTDCFKPNIAPICPIDEATSCVKFWVTNGVHCTNQTKPDFQVCAIAAFLCGLKSFALCILEDDFLLWLFQCWENPVVIHLRWFRVASFIALIGGLKITRPPLTFSICNVVFVELVFQTIPPHKFWRLENGEHKEVYGAHAGKTL